MGEKCRKVDKEMFSRGGVILNIVISLSVPQMPMFMMDVTGYDLKIHDERK